MITLVVDNPEMHDCVDNICSNYANVSFFRCMQSKLELELESKMSATPTEESTDVLATRDSAGFDWEDISVPSPPKEHEHLIPPKSSTVSWVQ